MFLTKIVQLVNEFTFRKKSQILQNSRSNTPTEMENEITAELEKDKYLNHLRTIEEHYDEHLNEILSNALHRGDVVSADRLLGYTDALMATCATFLVIPIRNLREMEANESLWSFVLRIRAQFIMFFFGFIVVLNIWENINIRAMVVKRVDDFILIFVIVSHLATSILPFSLALQGNFSDEKVSIILTCSILGFIQIIDIILVLYAMNTPKVLHIEMQNWNKFELKRFRNRFLIRPSISLAMIVLGAIFCFVHYIVSWVIIGVFTFMPTIRKLILFYQRRISNPINMKKEMFSFYFSKGNISKDRVESMSDAATAIIASILVLDITIENIPTKASVKESGLHTSLALMKLQFLTFLAAFTMVSLLWYTNHTVLHLFKTVTTLMLHLQKIFLAFSCLCPLAGNIIFKFYHLENKDSQYSVLFLSIVICWSSSANLLILLYGLLTGTKYLHYWAAFGSFKENAHQHLYVIIKASNLPFWSLFSLIGSFGSPKAANFVLYICTIAALTTFFILKFILNKVNKRNDNNQKPELHFNDIVKVNSTPKVIETNILSNSLSINKVSTV
ncbi:endosomal/lysosomal proton channel TMEM175 isoform X2 [Hydra vulgaris]|uniref:Endosomal/lysosomal proton channel TMEM175 n=1 Tax=Hydra vulgaris TaxID=6087 RepID=A0ABM4DB30_HYDVU